MPNTPYATDRLVADFYTVCWLLAEAAVQVIECRKVLQWTYVFGYYLKTGPEKNLFEFLQVRLKRQLATIPSIFFSLPLMIHSNRCFRKIWRRIQKPYTSWWRPPSKRSAHYIYPSKTPSIFKHPMCDFYRSI